MTVYLRRDVEPTWHNY